MTDDSEKLLTALCYVYGYVSSGIRTVLEQWDQRMDSERGRADLRAIVARSVELLERRLDELPELVTEHERKHP